MSAPARVIAGSTGPLPDARRDHRALTEALLVVDVKEAFTDPSWGPRGNPACEDNIVALIDAFRRRGQPVVFVRHDSTDPASTLHPIHPGNALQSRLVAEPDLLVAKSVNSAFLGEPSLERWLRAERIDGVAVCDITTNHCCESTARVGGNLRFAVRFVIDATHTFDRTGPDGTVHPAALLAQITAANFDGEFATVVSTADVL